MRHISCQFCNLIINSLNLLMTKNVNSQRHISCHFYTQCIQSFEVNVSEIN